MILHCINVHLQVEFFLSFPILISLEMRLRFDRDSFISENQYFSAFFLYTLGYRSWLRNAHA